MKYVYSSKCVMDKYVIVNLIIGTNCPDILGQAVSTLRPESTAETYM